MTPATLWDLRAATLAARTRTGDNNVSTSVKGGLVRVVRVTYGARGQSTVEPLTDFQPVEHAVAFLAHMGAPLCRVCRQPVLDEELRTAHPRLGPEHAAPVLCAIATIRARKTASPTPTASPTYA